MSDTNQAVQLQKMARVLKFRIKVEEGFTIYVAQTKALIERGYREADLRLCFRVCQKSVFSYRGSYCEHAIH